MAAAASNLTPVCCLINTNWEFVAVAYNHYIHVIGEVEGYYGVHEIIAFDV